MHSCTSTPKPPQFQIGKSILHYTLQVAPQLRIFSIQKGQSGPTLLSMYNFVSSPRLYGRSSACVTSFKLKNPSYFSSLLSQETFVNIAGPRNAAWLSSVPYRSVLATKLWQWLSCHCLPSIPCCAAVLPSSMGRGGQVSPCTPCFMSTSSLCGCSISSTRLSMPYPPLISSKIC